MFMPSKLGVPEPGVHSLSMLHMQMLMAGNLSNNLMLSAVT